MEFDATVEAAGRTATGIVVPDAVLARLAAGRRPAVVVVIGGHTYRTTVAVRGGRFMIPLSAENRSAAGVSAGDRVAVDISVDAAPREVVVPPDLGQALAADPAVQGFFDGLAHSYRKEWVRWIEEAKQPATRAGRLSATVEAMRAGRRAR